MSNRTAANYLGVVDKLGTNLQIAKERAGRTQVHHTSALAEVMTAQARYDGAVNELKRLEKAEVSK
jgi:hypothetical protein